VAAASRLPKTFQHGTTSQAPGQLEAAVREHKTSAASETSSTQRLRSRLGTFTQDLHDPATWAARRRWRTARDLSGGAPDTPAVLSPQLSGGHDLQPNPLSRMAAALPSGRIE